LGLKRGLKKPWAREEENKNALGARKISLFPFAPNVFPRNFQRVLINFQMRSATFQSVPPTHSQ
jgi:hypothetical protein